MNATGRTIVARSARAPFFVMGCRRSGTTLVSQILDSHSRLASYHESYFFNIFRPELRWYGELADRRCLNALIADVRRVIRDQRAEPPDADELARAVAAPTLEAVLAAVLHLYARSRGKMRGGDKTPEHYLYLDEILEKLPESPVIFLMRDPRDAAHSIRRTMDAAIEDGARSWNAAWMALQAARRPVHLVRYEDLVTRPVEHVRRMCAHLGELYEDDMLTFYTRTPDQFRNRRGGEKLDKPMDAGAVGVYRQHLTAREIATVESLCGQGMESMGYAFDRAPTSVRIPARAAPASQSFFVLLVERARYYGLRRERWRRGMVRWRMMLRVRARYVASMVIGSSRGSRG